jgi:hypothetical protein
VEENESKSKLTWGEREKAVARLFVAVHGALAQSQFSSAAADVATSLCPLGIRAVWGSPTSDETAADMGETLADRRAANDASPSTRHPTGTEPWTRALKRRRATAR